MAIDGSGDEPNDKAWLKELAGQRQGRSRTGPTPRGRSVSSALILPPGALPRDRQLRALLATIDAVHGDGDLPPLRVRWGIPRMGEVAAYTVTMDMSEPIALTVDSRRARWRIGMLHEIGHFLDHLGIGTPVEFASRGDELLREWRTTVRRSQAFGVLRTFSDVGSYFGRPEELWARSYAQWIAVRSGEETLRRQVVELRGNDPEDLAFFLQWNDDDFEPIAETIDRLFRRLRWLT